MPIKKSEIMISLSDCPLGAFRILPELSGSAHIPIVPLEFVRANLDLLIGENRLYVKEAGTGNVLGYIQDAHAALDIIDHSLFLYVETSLSYAAFLNEYADVPEVCPACQEEMDFLDDEERLEHIIRCRWNGMRSIVAAAAKAMEPPQLLH